MERSEAKDRSLEQGDLIKSCPIMMPSCELIESHSYEIDVKEYDVVILTQSCDLNHGKVEKILVCPYYNFTQFYSGLATNIKQSYPKDKYFESLRKGIHPSNHLLNEDKSAGILDYLVVDFKSVFAIHFNYIPALLDIYPNDRIRLLPHPYKEHLSQAFARFFMRVGLPIDIQKTR